MDIEEKIDLLARGYTREQCDAIDVAREAQEAADQAAEKAASGRQRKS